MYFYETIHTDEKKDGFIKHIVLQAYWQSEGEI
jgi:hypothetical protein